MGCSPSGQNYFWRDSSRIYHSFYVWCSGVFLSIGYILDICSITVSSRNFRGILDLAPGTSSCGPSSLTLIFKELFLSFFLFSLLTACQPFHPFFSVLKAPSSQLTWLCSLCFLCSLTLFADVTTWETEKTLSPFKHCSAITKKSLYYQHHFQDKSKTQHHTRCYEEN